MAEKNTFKCMYKELGVSILLILSTFLRLYKMTEINYAPMLVFIHLFSFVPLIGFFAVKTKIMFMVVMGISLFNNTAYLTGYLFSSPTEPAIISYVFGWTIQFAIACIVTVIVMMILVLHKIIKGEDAYEP